MKLNLNPPEKFYITTPIYYANDRLHIGHAYTTIASDILARYYRLIGADVFFLTGTDEHGLKVQKSTEEKGIDPQEFLDSLVKEVKKTWNELDISYDYFIRTTNKKHEETVKEIVQKMYERGDIYKGEYEGYYCKGCESFYKEKDIQNNKCPHNHKVIKEKEDAYFFNLRKYQDWLLDFYEKNPNFIRPESRKNEIVSFVKQGLEDLCISREKVSWGVTLPFDEKYTIYVWLDALFNYVTALNYPDGENFKKFWPADFQLMGKEIVKFHAVYWPIFLKSLDLELPKCEFGHGWWTVEGEKMSKSIGNVIYPTDYVNSYGSDIFRYYLIREVSFGEDGSFSKKSFINRINNDLVSNIGNLYSRVISLGLKKNQENGYEYAEDKDLINRLEAEIKEINNLYQNKKLTKALVETFKLSDILNRYVQEKKPWETLKNNPEEFDKTIYVLLESLRNLALLLSPVFVNKSKIMFEQLGLDFNDPKNKDLGFTSIMKNKTLKKTQHIFTKVEE